MKKMLFMLFSAACMTGLTGESSNLFGSDDIPLKKVTLYSSGVAHYLHEGTVSGSGEIELLFSPEQINDVLKSLVVMDPSAKKLSVNYQSKDTLQKTLESLKTDLSSSVTLYDILKSQKGAEIELFTPKPITGKILSVDKNRTEGSGETFFISLVSKDGIHVIAFSDIRSFKFTDEKRNEDLNTALDLILNASANNRKKLGINIEAQGERKIKLSYVMEAPVWKASYRLDMGLDKAAFQAWAIVDNSTDLDWKNIILTLTTGRPVAFRQNLYAPYYTERPEIPLAIAQAAEAEVFDSGDYEETKSYAPSAMPLMERSIMSKGESKTLSRGNSYYNDSAYFENQIEAGKSGEMFAFTPSKPVTLERQKSMMIPLTLASIPAEKFSVFSSIPYNESVNPKFCISIENKSGLKLPAGPITVFDGGEYVGDALLEFLPEGEKRLIAYGDDIEITGRKTDSTLKNIETVKITDGILHTVYKQIQNTKYSIRNADKNDRTIIIEHQKWAGFELVTKDNLAETAGNKYRFKLKAKSGINSDIEIKESRIYMETHKIAEMNSETYIYYTTNSEIPENIRKTFEAIIKEKEKISEKRNILNELKKHSENISKEQDRIRKNLEAVGSETQQGAEFLNKLLKLETELDSLKNNISAAEKDLQKAESDFIKFLKKIKIE